MSRKNKEAIFGLFAGAALLAALVVYPVSYRGSTKAVTFTVSEKERVVQSNGDSVSSRYLVYTNTGVYENTDSFLFGKFNSSDVHGQLKVGKRYKCTVAGWRIPFFSCYPNIVGVTQLADVAPKPKKTASD